MSGRKRLPKGWRWAKLGDIALFLDSQRKPINESEREKRICGKNENELYPYFGANGQVGWIDEYLFDEDLVLLAEDGGAFGSKNTPIAYQISGKTWVNNHAHVLRPREDLIIGDFLYFSIFIRPDILPFISGSTRAKLNQKYAQEIPISLPPLAVQELITEVLQQADAIRRKRTEARRLADQILPAAFYGLFGDVDPGNTEFNVVRLDEVADIRSGVTKGRRLERKETIAVPYLRVANVQDGFLDVTEIKEISVLPMDVQKYHLEDGDILMTEGGDPDKLGRGCIWREQVKGCIHQNHIFRVRPDKTRLLPEFLAAILRTSYAKAYFFRAAKRTSNLASINSTQVKNFSFPLPPMEMQRKFLLRVEQWDKAIGQSTDALHLSERTFAVLHSRAFTGELTAEWEAANADWIAERQTFYERLSQLALLALLLEQRRRAGRKAGTLITALMKYTFLAQMEGELRRRLYRFIPYHHGPCAMELYTDLQALQADGLIVIENDADEDKTRITLTDSARATALLEEEARKDDVRLAALEKAGEDTETAIDPAMSRLLKRRAETIETLRADTAAILDTYGNLDHNTLLKTVYEKYPTYAKNSVRKARKSTS